MIIITNMEIIASIIQYQKTHNYNSTILPANSDLNYIKDMSDRLKEISKLHEKIYYSDIG